MAYKEREKLRLHLRKLNVRDEGEKREEPKKIRQENEEIWLAGKNE